MPEELKPESATPALPAPSTFSPLSLEGKFIIRDLQVKAASLENFLQQRINDLNKMRADIENTIKAEATRLGIDIKKHAFDWDSLLFHPIAEPVAPAPAPTPAPAPAIGPAPDAV